MYIPSIFNDVIGPVMRGPSSSHSAAAVRIGRIARDLMKERITEVVVHFDLGGSLPTTYLSQGSDMGLSGGLLGFDAADARLVNYRHELAQAGITIRYISEQLADEHPNTYNLVLRNSQEEHSMVAISTGGGMIEVTSIDNQRLSFRGDRFALAIWADNQNTAVTTVLENAQCLIQPTLTSNNHLLLAERHRPFEKELIDKIASTPGVKSYRTLNPVLPILTPPATAVPFSSPRQLMLAATPNSRLDEMALTYEAARGGIGEEMVMRKMLDLVDILDTSVAEGLRGTEYRDRILGYQSGAYQAAQKSGKIVDLGLLNQIIPYVTALMETKSSMGVFVAAPTAGSCGGLPGTVLAICDASGRGRLEKARGLLAAGLVGACIAADSTFSAEVCGCQAECGVSSGMTAAAVVALMGGNAAIALSAASMALQNIFGMVCDPVANRVEVPCLGKNILAASNAMCCANMALAGFDHIIPFDETVAAMDKVGRALPHELRCTALGGLSMTKTSKTIEDKLSRMPI